MDERIERARQLYDRAVFDDDESALPAASVALDGVEADLCLARGRIVHARFLADGTDDPDELVLFERAARLYHALGDGRGEGEATFWAGTYHQVVRHDNAAAIPALKRAHELAIRAGDQLTTSYAARHLGIAEHAAGRLGAARTWLEESVRLRREIGFQPGVAANLVGLAHIAVDEGRLDEAAGLIDEATGIAEAGDARSILRWIDEARARL